jgi:hypothetical protein
MFAPDGKDDGNDVHRTVARVNLTPSIAVWFDSPSHPSHSNADAATVCHWREKRSHGSSRATG